jgi:hypothetical protein
VRHSPSSAALLAITVALLSTGCRLGLDRLARHRLVPSLTASDDLQMACTVGEIATGASLSVGRRKSPDDALTLAGLSSGVCIEQQAMGRDLDGRVLLAGMTGEGRVPVATDHQAQARRLHLLAASRFADGYAATRRSYPSDAPRGDDKQAIYLLGMLSGALSLVNDSAAGGALGVPQNLLLDVARSAGTLDDDRWWGIPSALQGTAWAVIPGSGPQGVDPWQVLRDAANKGDAAGQTVPRSLYIFSLVNAGRTSELADSLPSASLNVSPEWPLLAAYGRARIQYDLDRVWIEATGHRALTPMVLPPAAQVVDDPFGDDNSSPAPSTAPDSATTPAP